MKRYEIWGCEHDYIVLTCYNELWVKEYVDAMKKARLERKYMLYIFNHDNNKLLEQAIIKL